MIACHRHRDLSTTANGSDAMSALQICSKQLQPERLFKYSVGALEWMEVADGLDAIAWTGHEIQHGLNVLSRDAEH